MQYLSGMKKTIRQKFQEAPDNKSGAILNTDSTSHKVKHEVAPNFLRHVYSESLPDLAKITIAEAEGDYDTIIRYLEGLKEHIEKWIGELKNESGTYRNI